MTKWFTSVSVWELEGRPKSNREDDQKVKIDNYEDLESQKSLRNPHVNNHFGRVQKERIDHKYIKNS